MRESFFKISLLSLLSLLIFSSLQAEEQSIKSFINKIQESFNSKDVSSYLDAFKPEIRHKEKLAYESILTDLDMNRITFHKVKKTFEENGQVKANSQVFYNNDYSTFVETWKLNLSRLDEGWQIEKKDVSSRVNILYKVNIPSERIERVESIEINHVDIDISFKDAVLFYDNIPNVETALLVIGKGDLYFSPSDPKEKHQLQLLYKKNTLEGKIDYIYLRFSNSFFQNNIKIKKASGERIEPVSQAEINQAYSLFHKHYSQSFTIENSYQSGFYSILPQGDQAVFDFEGKKIGQMTYLYSPFSLDEVTLINKEKNMLVNLYSPLKEENDKRIFISLGQKFDIKNYKIEIDFNPSKSYLSGRAKIEVEAQMDSLDSIKLKLNPELSILRIFDEENNELFFTQDRVRSLLYVYLAQNVSQKESLKIEVFYRGRLVPPQQTADVISQKRTVFQDKEIFPTIFQSHLFSQSSYWYPSPADIDFFQAQLKVIVPPEYTCIANGELKETGELNEVEEVVGIEKMGNSIYVFETKNPVKYLSFIAGKFIKVDESTQSLPIDVFVTSIQRFEFQDSIEEARDIIGFYEGLFGSFPYEKMSIVMRIWPHVGGHSPASFIVINELPLEGIAGYYVNTNSPVDLSRWKEYFIAHEIAHQWWGQGVAWASYRDQWLSEGLAQFSSILYLREKRSKRVFSQILKKFSSWTNKKSFYGAITMGSRLSYLDFYAYQSIVYNKSSLVLNMLREILGDNVFFAGLKEFFASFKYKEAQTSDFVRIMEEVSGYDLQLFFNGWLDSYALPEVKVNRTILMDGDDYILKFQFDQQGKEDPFQFPLWIEWRENGKKVKKKIIISKKNEEFEFHLANKPNKIMINPDEAVPGKFH